MPIDVADLIHSAVTMGRDVHDGVRFAHVNEEHRVIDGAVVFIREIPRLGGISDLVLASEKGVCEFNVLLGCPEIRTAGGIPERAAVHP